MPVPGPTMMTGADGSAGRRKPCERRTNTETARPGFRYSATKLEPTPW